MTGRISPVVSHAAVCPSPPFAFGLQQYVYSFSYFPLFFLTFRFFTRRPLPFFFFFLRLLAQQQPIWRAEDVDQVAGCESTGASSCLIVGNYVLREGRRRAASNASVIVPTPI